MSSAPAAGGMFPTLSLRIFLQMPDPVPRRSHGVHMPVSSSVSSAFPQSRVGRLSRENPANTTLRGPFFRGLQVFLYVQLRAAKLLKRLSDKEVIPD